MKGCVMEFDTAKTFFGVGLIVALVGGFTSFVDMGAVGLLGLVLTLIGAYGLSEHYGRRDIFNNMLIATIIAFVGSVVVALLILGSLVGIAITNPAALHNIWSIIGVLIAVWLGLWVLVIVSTYFERKAFIALYEASGSDNFKKAADFVWWGALLFVILVGLVLFLVGAIFAIIGAFELKPPRKESGYYTASQ